MRRVLAALVLALLPSLGWAQINVSGSGSSGASVTGTNDFTGANSFLDNDNFTLKNTSDPTKTAIFNLGAVTAGNKVTLHLGGTAASPYALLGGSTTAFNAWDWNTAQTPDTGMLLTGTTGNSWVVAEQQDRAFDFAHAAATNPTLFIHSAAQSTSQWLSLSHDGTYGNINSGGSLITSASVWDFTNELAARGNLVLGANGTAAANGSFFQATGQTPDAPMFRTGTTSNSFLIVESADAGFDFAHAASTDPTLFIQSHNQVTTQWLGFNHNGTDGVISTGLGALKVSSASGIILSTGTAPTVSACGTSPGTVTGSATAGRLTTGSGAGVQSCTLTFVPALAAAPECVANDESAILLIRAVATTTTLVIDSAVAGTLASQVLTYHCLGGV